MGCRVFNSSCLSLTISFDSPQMLFIQFVIKIFLFTALFRSYASMQWKSIESRCKRVRRSTSLRQSSEKFHIGYYILLYYLKNRKPISINCKQSIFFSAQMQRNRAMQPDQRAAPAIKAQFRYQFSNNLLSISTTTEINMSFCSSGRNLWIVWMYPIINILIQEQYLISQKRYYCGRHDYRIKYFWTVRPLIFRLGEISD